jgi:Protein of unknown function (DUF3313)
MKTKQMMALAVVISIMFFAGTALAKEKIKYSGFIDNYPEMTKGKKADFVFKKEGTDFKAYTKIMMDHVVFYFHKDSKYKGIHADELKQLADAFHKAFAEALGDAYPIVDAPGPDVLRVRTAITNVKPSKPALNTITSIIPIGLAFSTIKKATTGTHANVGAASLEAEFLDSQSNGQLAVVIDAESGAKYKVVSGMSKWGHANDAFKKWAKSLREWLDEVHGKK